MRNLRYSGWAGIYMPSSQYPVGRSDAMAQTYLTGRPNLLLGCDGSRKFLGIADDEMVMGFPGEMRPEMRG
ncbi:MAG: DUF169 domain-containing protein [Methanoregulaceae archaeon]|nr:DUF169 domain-containing protein [Methanoregulaceae archaeon]